MKAKVTTYRRQAGLRNSLRENSLSSRRGVALVITLLMLSVVTFMAVIFLAVSRRERASVAAAAESTEAHLMADAALARAQAEVVARILSATNEGAFDLLISTNYASPVGFQSQGINNTTPNLANVGYWVLSPNNINYDDPATGKPLLSGKSDWLQNIANLMYDPRPPVFIRTNFDRAGSGVRQDWDFRFYLDLNQNGRFDDTKITNEIRLGISTNIYQLNGDPQWIGVLEHPDRPHSESNRFVGRLAFIVLPAGKSLDLNFMHNYAKQGAVAMPDDRYFRNQGIGSWELNLAAFFHDLNTNLWPSYAYQTNGFPNTGEAFDDAVALLRYRYGDLSKLPSLQNAFGLSGVAGLSRTNIDLYADAPFRASNPALPWWGNESQNSLFTIEELFDADYISPSLYNKFARLRTNALFNSTAYNRSTFYRMLAQMSTDSRPALSNKLFQADFERHPTNKFHLNFQPTADATRQAQGILWDPEFDWSPLDTRRPGNATNFFYQVADRILRASLTTNAIVWKGILTNAFFLNGIPVRGDFSLTNILIYHPPTNGAPPWETNSQYSSAVHQLLQQAANIYDATTTRLLTKSNGGVGDYPTVFRPLFGTATDGSIRIIGFDEVRNTSPLFNSWRDLRLPADRAALRQGDNIMGVPWVIGAKKGYPNFNEFSLETVAQVSRKVAVAKIAPGRLLFLTNQMHVLSVSNIVGVEIWNSYTNTFMNQVVLVVSNDFHYALSNVVNGRTNLVLASRGVMGNRLQPTNWFGRTSPDSFLLPIHTNIFIVTNAAYLATRPPRYLFNPNETNNFESSLDSPVLRLYMTNRLRYWLIDQGVTPPRIIDFVNLDGMNSSLDITQALIGNQSSGNIFATTNVEQTVWMTNKVGGFGANAPSQGIITQIAVSKGDITINESEWASNPLSINVGQRADEITKFRRFLTNPLDTNSTQQVPFTPTKKIYQHLSWQANDPLVHYTIGDLSDSDLTNPNQANNFTQIRPPQGPLPESNLKLRNDRYRPWGGNPDKQASGASAADAYSVAYKDSQIVWPDHWNFPTNKFPNVGWLGRVHRGTPWQTIYLKSHLDPGTGKPIAFQDWGKWSGSFSTHPTNDWKLLELFTTAPNANATRGLLAVNQTNLAAWSAVLSGVHVFTNSYLTGPALATHYVAPSSPQLLAVVNGINRMRAQWTNGLFEHLGDILSAPELTTRSPFLNFSRPDRIPTTVTDDVVERIPQQILSLLKMDEPRVVVYAFGQSLKPAPRSIVTSGNFYNICTNYQITGEAAYKAVLRVEDAPKRPRVIIESFNVLPPQ